LIFKYSFLLQEANYVEWIDVSLTGSQWLARTLPSFSCFGSDVKFEVPTGNLLISRCSVVNEGLEFRTRNWRETETDAATLQSIT
jgi:hypothetical protein